MLSLSLTTGYAIKALSCLDSGACATQQISDIARCSGVPRPYLAKILHALSRHGLVITKRGYRGGIVLARSADEISLQEIVVAVEGKSWLGPCLLGMGDCSDDCTCPTHRFWKRITREIRTELGALALADVIRSRGKLDRTRHAGSNRGVCVAPRRKRSRHLSISAVGVELNA